MILYKRHEHKLRHQKPQATLFYYTYSTPKWKSMHANSNHSTSACTIHADLHKPRLTKNIKQDDTVTTKHMHVRACETLQAERTWLVARGGGWAFMTTITSTVQIGDHSYECRGAIVPTQGLLHRRCRPLGVELAADGTTVFCVVFHGQSIYSRRCIRAKLNTHTIFIAAPQKGGRRRSRGFHGVPWTSVYYSWIRLLGCRN